MVSRAPLVDGELAVLDRHVLRIYFRSDAPFITAALASEDGGAPRFALVAKHGTEYRSEIDLRQCPPGEYTIALQAAAGDRVPFGRNLADRQLRRSHNGEVQSVPHSVFTVDARQRFATVRLDFDRMRLLLSETEDKGAAPERRRDTDGNITRPHFSIVVAMHNVAKYLDQFFTSVTKQPAFRTHMELIAVDDGSTDGTAKVAKRWARRFPKKIRYIFKENGGVSEARNVGLEYTSGEWVLFFDPDDYIAPDYIEQIERAIHRHRDRDICAIVCRTIIYVESTDTYRPHYLQYRFDNGEQVVPVEHSERYPQLSVNCVCLRSSVIGRHGLRFDPRIRPNFEDAHFYARYLFNSSGSQILFLPQAKYFYRTRADATSLVQTAPHDPRWFGDQLEFGNLALLHETSRDGPVPTFIQQIMLCEPQLHEVVEHPERVAFLSSEQRSRLHDLLVQILRFIDIETILDPATSGFGWLYSVGILGFFKNCDPPRQRIQVFDHDATSRLIGLCIWSREREPSAAFFVDGVEIEPAYVKLRRHDFLDTLFVWEHVIWLPSPTDGALECRVSGRSADIKLRQKIVSSATIDDIRSAFVPEVPQPSGLSEIGRHMRQQARSRNVSTLFRDAWLFMDRDVSAGNLAEYLYRYAMRHRSAINAFFVLRQDSPDWPRLARLGFRLLPFGEVPHYLALLNAARLISSQSDRYVWGSLPSHETADMVRYKFALLQHEVMRDDIPKRLNDVPVDMIAVASRHDFDLIAGDGSPYRFGRKETVLVGSARHDALLSAPVRDDRVLVIAPVGRESLFRYSKRYSGGKGREFDFLSDPGPELQHSNAMSRWKSLLHSAALAEVARHAGCRVVLLPHWQLLGQVDFFELPDWVEACPPYGEAVLGLIRGLTLLVTDYSSYASDAALIGKPLIYYNRENHAFAGMQAWQTTHFDPCRDGFGPVSPDEATLVGSIATTLNAGSTAAQAYRDRAMKAFPFGSGGSSERILDAIAALDRPYGASS